MRSLTTLGAGLLAAAVLAAPGAATMPTVQVVVRDAAVKLSGHDDLGSGPVRLELERDGGEARSIAVIELKEGKKASDLGRLAGLQKPSAIERTGRLVAGITVKKGTTTALTLRARARTYVVVDASDERQAHAEFTPDATSSGASFGAHDARVDLRDGSIRIAPEKYLPRRGVVKVRNTGSRAHHALAIRLGSGVTVSEARRRLAKGSAPELVGSPVDLTGPLSAGARVDVEQTFRPGRYVLMDGRSRLASFRVR